jgi:hypothetical protein
VVQKDLNVFWRIRWIQAHYYDNANDLNLIEIFRLCCKLYLKSEMRIRLSEDIIFTREFDRTERKILQTIHQKLVDLHDKNTDFITIYTSEEVVKWCWSLL